MESEQKDYAYKNEISLSIGDDSADSSASTPSTVTPQSAPTPSPRALNDDTKPLTKNGDMMKPDGIDNKAFDNGTEKPPLSSFGNGQLNETANGANKNGQLNEKKLAEAVNLELININNNNSKKNGKNDLPVKKDDVEMGHKKDESYEEYFVPVNEHRKYMSNTKTRKLHGVDSNTGLSIVSTLGVINYNDWILTISRGEKLYVTKDKRAEKRKNKLCWILCIGIVAAVIILGILAASGAFSRMDSPVEARQFGDKTNNSQVVGAGFAVPSDKSSSTTQTPTTTTELPITMPPHLDETSAKPEPTAVHDEEITYVPNSLEGQITLSNAEYSSEYNDANSPIYKKLIKDLENEIKNALSSGGNDEFFVKIIGLKSGSVVVDYRVSWNSENDLTTAEMMQRIQTFLNRHNHQFMNRYNVNANTIRVARVPDRCATSSKNNCDFACGFNTDKVDFECLCPPNKKYDEDWGECVGDSDSIYVSPETSSEPEPSAEPEPTSDDHEHHHHHHLHHESSTAEPSSDYKSSTAEPSAEPEPSSEPEPSNDEHKSSTAEPSAEPEPSSDGSEHKSSTAEPEPSSEPEPSNDEHKSSTAEPSAEPEPSSDGSEHKSSTAEPSPASQGSSTQKNITKQFKLLDETENASSSKPVTEEIDDTPRPTEKFIISTTPRVQNELNIFDMNMTTQTNESTTIYATSSPVSIWHSENGSESHDMSPFLPESENSNSKTEQKTYSVTENISEIETAPHDQSPFLPEPENKHILSGTHATTPVSEETDEAKNSTHVDSLIINVIPIRIENATTPAVSTISSVDESSTVSTTTVKNEDEEEEKEESVDEENLFGDQVKKGEKKDEPEVVPSSTESTVAEIKNETSTEGIKLESNIEILTTVHQKQETSSTTESTSSTTQEKYKFSDEVVTLQPELRDDTKKEDLKLDFDTNNELLSVVPLRKSSVLTTTENPNLTSENEVTEKVGTTSNFFDITTLPAVVKQTVEEDESLLNRNAKVIPDDYYSKSDNKLEKTEEKKLFKPEFLETIAACPDDKFKCVYSNECVSRVKVCDGQAQCSDYSDEWNCYNVTSSNILEYKKDEKMMKICASKTWTKAMSDRVCNKMGLAAAAEWKANKDVKEEKYLTGELDKFEIVDACEEGVLEIQCIDFACGSNSTNRDAGEFSSISLLVDKDSTNRCTANIISPVWAITSASCAKKSKTIDLILIAGNTELNMSRISKNSVISLVSEIVTYPGNDFALIQFKSVLSFSDLVYAACLNMQPFKENNECLTTGWATRADNSLEKYEKIMEVHANCTSEQSNQLCAMPKNKPHEECYNDKGSSLYCFSQNEKRWLLNGIQNQENACANHSEPLKFSSLTPEAINWIKNTVGNSRMFA